jgi:hypothetical protein
VIVRLNIFSEAHQPMPEKKERFRGENYRRQRSQEMREPAFSVPAFPEASRISIKQIAFLHAYCREEPREIAARYPKCLTLADVHAALSHYFRDPEAIDAELKREMKFNTRDGLEGSAVGLPKVGLSALLDVA